MVEKLQDQHTGKVFFLFAWQLPTMPFHARECTSFASEWWLAETFFCINESQTAPSFML